MSAEWRGDGYICERCDGTFFKEKIHWDGDMKKWYCYHCIEYPTRPYQPKEWSLEDLKAELAIEEE